MNFLSSFQQRFGFTRNEIKVILFLTATFLAGLSIRWYRTHDIEAKPGGEQFDYSQSDKIFEERSKNLQQVSQKSKDSVSTKSKKKIPTSIINLNTASKEQLMQLPGIGEHYAERIITYRNKHGSFKTVNDLMKVKGIGKKKFETLKPLIAVE